MRAVQFDDKSLERKENDSVHKVNLRKIEPRESTADCRDQNLTHKANLSSKEPENERTIRLESQIKLYDTNKSLTSKRFLNIPRLHPG